MRTNPVFKWNYETDADVVVNQGGTSCFEKNTLVVSDTGNIPISKIKVGQNILSYNEETGKEEFKPVIAHWKFKNTKPTVRIKLKSGKTIICTDDHLFFVGGSWISIKHLLSLWTLKHKENETNTEF